MEDKANNKIQGLSQVKKNIDRLSSLKTPKKATTQLAKKATNKLAKRTLSSFTGGSSDLFFFSLNFFKKNPIAAGILIALSLVLNIILPVLIFLAPFFGIIFLVYKVSNTGIGRWAISAGESIVGVFKSAGKFLGILGVSSDNPIFAELVEGGRYSCVGDSFIIDTQTGEIIDIYDLASELSINLTCKYPLESYIDQEAQSLLSSRSTELP